MLRKLAIGSVGVTALALAPNVAAATPLQEQSNETAAPPPMKASELPMYEAPHAEYGESEREKTKKQKKNYMRDALLPPVQAVREQAQKVLYHTDSFKHTVEDNYRELEDRSQWLIQYFREEENKQVRYGAVAMGGLTGLIVGLRGGFIRRVLYVGMGATGMGFVCFPEDTKEIMKNNSVFAKQYINIAYNFFYGVKPGDPQLEVKFPELSFPKDFSEFVDLAVSMASSMKQAVMPPPSKEEVDAKPKSE